ncbi:MAG: acetate kinase [Clostridia bacterium]|nr:acetate kinase [Clostridia bacterium]
MKILVINAGSSSLKYQLIDMKDNSRLAIGICERIGTSGRFKHTTSDGRVYDAQIPMPNHNVAFHQMLDTLLKGEYSVISDISEINAIGHRIVNGGEKFSKSVLVDDQVLKDFGEVINFAPLHNPPAMVCIDACLEMFDSKVPNVLVFETAFHQTMPPKAYLFGVEYKYYEKYKVRRYGAHGTSHRYVGNRCAEIMNKDIKDLKIVTCHIGNGSSLAAIKNGVCIDTSMGFTPLAGVMMGTRSGTIDPSVVTFLMDKENLSPSEMEDMLNKRSGLLGISGISSDSRDLEAAIAKDDAKMAHLALGVMNYQIKSYVGAYVAAMNGIDALVFTAGIGENSDRTRRQVCEDMDYLGIKIDDKVNRSHIRDTELEITAPGARVRTFIIPTNEELMIALDTKRIVESL